MFSTALYSSFVALLQHTFLRRPTYSTLWEYNNSINVLILILFIQNICILRVIFNLNLKPKTLTVHCEGLNHQSSISNRLLVIISNELHKHQHEPQCV